MSEPSLPAGVVSDYPLDRLTTVRTGGVAELFARPTSEQQLVELLQWAEAAGKAVSMVGSGSNLLVADVGVEGLVLKLSGELVAIEQHREELVCGGGARLPSVAAYAARCGLAGIEFGVSIPGSVGGAVKMNAGAYDGELARVLKWVDLVTSEGVERRLPDSFSFQYRRSNLAQHEVVAKACFSLRPDSPEVVKERLADLRARRRAAQPVGIKTFGSTFKNPSAAEAGGRSAGQLLDLAGCRDLQVGGARFSPKHANFVENTGDATTEDVLAVMAAGRRKVFERFEVKLEPEVQFLGPVKLPSEWEL